ncbi:DUF368 domain-containing protein [Jeotgalibacillus soli]|uniref:DUF368 domain-containing protein n=1 Tax=Jeotgalibacillus soli TaxID=889306 RepID=A0A0C2W6E7_9BACL|nr:DUF368 domain-containing protein [Jeotgalibacillus soli]KIL52151.1 hypothetical protein KP78_05210 [Jeotgalibacillus soli]
MFDWRNLFRGMAMGTADLIPGVSGGTIAVILGIYDQFINGISNIISKEWKKHFVFLATIGVGMITAIILLSRIVEWLLVSYPQPTNFFFLGLILGILPFLLKESNYRENFKSKHVIALVISAILVACMVFFRPAEDGSPMENLTFLTYIGLYFAGWLASMAMLLPGISGSFVLLIIGVYPTALNAVSTLNIPLILVIGAGVATGFIISSKGIRYLLSRFPVMMYAIIIGLVFGSLFVVYPGLTLTLSNVMLSILALLLGLISAVKLGDKG